MSASNPLRCRIGWHRWKRVTFRIYAHPIGRRCDRCGLTQFWRPVVGPFDREWTTTTMQPNEDAHGYY